MRDRGERKDVLISPHPSPLLYQSVTRRVGIAFDADPTMDLV